MINLRKRFAGQGYMITDSPIDTIKIVCRFGHIYADGDALLASLDSGSPLQARALRKLGTPVMDGQDGELTIRFPDSKICDVTRLLKPRQAVITKRAA